WEAVLADAAVGRQLRVGRTGRVELDALGSAEVECPERGVELVGTEVRDVRAAEGPEVAPGDRVVRRVIRARFARTEPQIPVQPRRNPGLIIRRRHERAVPARAPDPAVHLADGPDGAGAEQLDDLAHRVARVADVAHLRRNAGLLRDPRDEPGL